MTALKIFVTFALLFPWLMGIGTAGEGDVKSLSPAATQRVEGAGSKPNFLLITSDDQSDTEMRWMPKTKRLLAKQGIVFTDAINPHPLCCPARAEIMTGEYGQNNGVRHNDGPFGGWDAFVKSNREENLANWLSAAGYKTGFIGKNLNGYSASDPQVKGWDFFSPTTSGTYSYYGTSFYNNGKPKRFGDKYVADIVRDESIRLIKQWSQGGKPFFIWASHVGPHDSSIGGKWGPPIPAKRHANMFRDLKIATLNKESFNEKDTSDKPFAIKRKEKLNVREKTYSFRQRVRSLQAIDEANAATIKALKRAGILNNTVVVYASDNGFQLGEHRLWSKNYPYEENLQIPFIMAGPSLPANTKSSMPVSLLDLAPTFLHYAGVWEDVKQKGETDGDSILWALDQPAREITFLIQGGTSKAKPLKVFGWEWRGVRTERYTYALWWNGFEELYDNEKDPLQLKNVAKQQRYSDVLRSLRGRYNDLKNCRGVNQCSRQNFTPTPEPK